MLLYGFLALALLGAIGTGVYKLKEWGADEVRAEVAKDAKEQRDREIKLGWKASKGLQADRVKIKTVYRTIEKVVNRDIEKLVVVRECLSPLGVLCVNAALRGESADSCRSDPAVPPVKPAG